MTATQTTTLQAANTYATQGWRVVPIKPGHKYPALKQWQDLATKNTETINHWWTTNHQNHGVGIATGKDSNIWVLDVDHTPTKNGYATLQTLVDTHGQLPKTLRAQTGSGGLHIYFQWDNNHPIRNSQGLSAPLGAGLDIRGDGGQVVAPPTIHPNGTQYTWLDNPETTPIAAAPPWIYQLLEHPPEHTQTPAPTGTHAAPEHTKIRLDTPATAPLGHDDSIAEWFRNTTDFATLLTADGWTENPQKAGYWARPGKTPRQGISARLHTNNGPLVIWSTNAPTALLNAATPTKTGDGVSISLFGYYAATRHPGPRTTSRSEAARHLRTERNTLEGRTPQTNATNTQPAHPEAFNNTQPAGLHLPTDFWDKRPVLSHIRQAAHARGRSADAVLGNTLARIAAHTPHNIVLPAIVGSHASLNIIHALVGPSGTGKTTSMEIASDLLTLTGKTNLNTLADVPLGSGEGISEAYFTMELEETGDTGGKGQPKKKAVKRQTIYAGLFISDEIDQLAQQAARSGATLMPTLRTAWSGGMLGQTNATEERKRRLPAHAYRFCLIVGVQPERAENLISDAAGGTPQRFTWFSTLDPSIPAPPERPEWPGQIKWCPPHIQQFKQTHKVAKRTTGIIDVPNNIAEEVATNDYLRQVGERNADLGSSHRDLARLKMAALLAILDERILINDDDWELSATIVDTSHAIYVSMVDAMAARAAEQANEAIRLRTVRADAELEARERRALSAAVTQLERKVRSAQQPVTPAQACRGFSHLAREANRDAVVQTAIEEHRVVLTEGGRLSRS